MYPNLDYEVDPERQKSLPLFKLPELPKGNKMLTIIVLACLVWLIGDTIYDICQQAGVETIVFDVVFVLLYTFIVAFSIRQDSLLKRLHKEDKKKKEYERIINSDPKFKIGLILPYHYRNTYLYNLGCSEARVRALEKRAPKKYTKKLSIASDLTDNIDRVLKVIAKDPEVLKELAKIDKASAKFEALVLQKFEKLQFESDEDLEVLYKKYKDMERARNYARKYYNRDHKK